MRNLKSAFQVLAVYLSLSRPGKGFLKKAVKNSHLANQKLGHPARLGLDKILYFIRIFKVCDKVFKAQVSGKLCADLGRQYGAMYSRFVAYGWFSLLLWSRLLEAFNLDFDQGAKERCVLVAFTHREWNDLFDNRGYTFDQLIQAFDYESSIPKELSLLRQLKHLERNYIPSEHAKAFYRHLEDLHVCSLFEYTPQKAQIILDQVAPFVALVFIHVMVERVPAELEAAVKPIARWMYMLDEFIDLGRDRKIGRTTYMTMSNDPEGAIRQQCELCRQAVSQYATRPDNFIKLIEMVTSIVINSKQKGVDLENSFLSLN